MRRLKNTISTKIKMMRINSIRTIFLFILFFFLNVSLTADGHSWKEYQLRELIGRLKYYTFAKVAQSLRGVYPTSQEQLWEKSNCHVTVPELPGPFFCGLLRHQHPSSVPDSSANIDSSPNSISKDYKNIQLYTGTTIAGKNVVQITSDENPGDSLRAFYLTDGHLSHYEFQDRILIFDWSGSKLNGILEVKVDPILRPLSGREILFP
ncbi:LIC_11883 family protein [Leptospira stimsonii]|uniref:Uncharacterized protein n=1 Tax=Leptospira stimsonii TaxID=2202203 RepID=A0A4R9L3I7_9LEPT|nr:hypothetical protein [Leptospira stimsonii]RHX86541.1 hypothetical protein DLM78_12130 [Leptospira stimsonii]TGK14350.1 hypothetical protein EHO98_15815 [Leptospira stimsonii]TGM11713.1 hypothetical protein EHQ90_15990 [Leptospira stimsonii]